MTDCPLCGAIAPVHGEIEHAWDCPESDHPKHFADWDDKCKSTMPDYVQPMPRTRGDRAALLRLALKCEAAWDALRMKRRTESQNVMIRAASACARAAAAARRRQIIMRLVMQFVHD